MIAPRRGAPSVRAILSGAAAVVLVSLVAAGAESRRSLSHRPLTAARSLVDASRHASAALALAALVAAVAVLASVFQRRRSSALGRPARRRMTRREKMLTAIAALLALASVMTVRVLDTSRTRRPTPRTAPPTGSRSSHQPSWQVGLSPTVVIAVIALLAVVAGIFVVRAHRLRPVADRAPDALAAAAAGARRALLADPDPRRAIIAAYLAMEQRLGNHGFVLTRSRTADEVLRGAAAGRYVDRDSASVLVRLFERARFSAQRLTAADRDRALAALDALAAGEPR